MFVHIYYDRYILRYNGYELVLSQNQFKILEYFIRYKDYDKVIKYIVNEEPDLVTLNKIRSNIVTLIENIEKKLKINLLEIQHIELSGEYGKYFPRVLNIEITNKCNFFCGHCYKSAHSKLNSNLNTDIIDYICTKFKNKVQVVHLTGGEPLIHPSINSIIDKLFKSGFLINITTNGSLFGNVSFENLSKINNFQVSLYGCNMNTYTEITGNNAFSKVKSFIEFLETNKIKYDLGLVINKVYLEHHDDFNKFINQLSPKKLIVSFPQKAGRLENNPNSIWDLNQQEISQVHTYLNDLNLFNDIKSQHYKCNAGTLSYSIDELGNVGLCQVIGSRCYSIGTVENLYQRCLHNNFDINEEMDKNGLKNKINPMCPYYKLRNVKELTREI